MASVLLNKALSDGYSALSFSSIHNSTLDRLVPVFLWALLYVAAHDFEQNEFPDFDLLMRVGVLEISERQFVQIVFILFCW